MSIPDNPPIQVLALVLGLIVGSFLNVLALRTLAEKSIVWPPSHCPACEKTLSPLDNIPVLSYILLRGRCRYCQAKISWQYPVVELATGIMFLAFYKSFGLSWYLLGMLIFGCTLITVTITDFREKLIPHDITYPSMLVGILFSATVRNDLMGAMAGIGASYILFDFLAHYGLKFYLASYGKDEPAAEDEPADDLIDESFHLRKSESEDENLDEFEVMGGGDAVLAAVISAWLGWQRLSVAIVIGFIVGTLMGTLLLIKHMRHAGLVREAIRPAIAGGIIGFALMAMPAVIMGVVTNISMAEMPWIMAGVLGAVGGALLGIISVGTRVSKPFPFGPALAVGALVAIYWDPIGLLFKGGA